MSKPITYEVEPKENFYFAIRVIISLLFYGALGAAIAYGLTTEPGIFLLGIVSFYLSLFALFIIFQLGILIGYLKGNAVKVSERQFPDIHEIVLQQTQELGLPSVPDAYLLEQGGLLNAFATRFFGKNYVVIYSDIIEEAYENNRETVEFVIGHELGHIQRKHLTKRLLLFP